MLLFCFQAEGGKKAEAVATVLAAVDLARVRQPGHDEGGVAAEEEAVETGIRHQETVEKEIIAMKTFLVEPPAAVDVTSEQQKVEVSQISHASKASEISQISQVSQISQLSQVSEVSQVRGVQQIYVRFYTIHLTERTKFNRS